MPQIRTGAIVKGTVIDVKEGEIILNIGYKADGIVTKQEYTNDASVVLTEAVHVGDEMEVKGIVGWCAGPSYVLDDESGISQIPQDAPITVVSQTTFNAKKFKELVEKISERSYNKHVVNTICNATQERQTEASAIAERADVMIVIGGRQSSNTQKLYDICRSACHRTYYIQTPEDLTTLSFAPVSSVGITAGASTPNNIIEEVYTHVRSKL